MVRGGCEVSCIVETSLKAAKQSTERAVTHTVLLPTAGLETQGRSETSASNVDAVVSETAQSVLPGKQSIMTVL